MQIAVYAPTTAERFRLAQLVEEVLLPMGNMPKISLFPIPLELLENTARRVDPFHVILLSECEDAAVTQQLCSITQVVVIGAKDGGPDAFENGAAYFLEAPAGKDCLKKALEHCIHKKRKTHPTTAAAGCWRY